MYCEYGTEDERRKELQWLVPSVFHLVALTLRELELLSRLRLTGLLPLNRTCIAGQESEATELGAMVFVDLHEGTRDREAERAGLARLATPR